MTGALLALSGLVGVAGSGVVSTPAPAAAAEGSTTDVLIVGDSITHASVGDYSWRYFAWKHLRKVGADVDFVGPTRDPYVGEGSPWTAEYADPGFDQDHAATWGDRIAYRPMHDRDALLRTYLPDVVVLELGTNDLGWMRMEPDAVLPYARAWVSSARVLAPGVDVVLVEVPWTTHQKAVTYNGLLAGLATEMNTADERVVLARAASGYTMGRDDDQVADTYDPVHPNTRGQVKIAAAVTDALSTLGIGRQYPRPLVFPAEGPRVVPTVTYRATDATATLSWDVPPGATSFDVWVKAPDTTWTRRVRAHPQSYPETTYEVSDMETCRPYDFRVLARKGWTLAGADVTSPVVTARVGPRVTERPVARVSTTRKRATVTWRALPGGGAPTRSRPSTATRGGASWSGRP